MQKIEKVFTDCSMVFLEKTFGIRQVSVLDELSLWLNLADTIVLTETEQNVIPIFQYSLNKNVISWNEQDLSLHFVGPMVSLVDFTEPYRYNLFAERRISAELLSVNNENYYLFGRPDEMIASGFREPEAPYFFINEFKRETDPNGSPLAQVLAAMLVGQAINQNQHPIYGCYILGRDWYFLALKDSSFAISKGYDATTEQVFDLYRILKALKEMVKQLTETTNE